jgi:quaternary ammonium compound-resistance protein SugE
MWASFLLLGLALKELPISTAYPVWVGIGAIGVAIAGIVLFNESAAMPKLAFLSLIVIGIIGLKFYS